MKICEICGAALDATEKCDCMDYYDGLANEYFDAKTDFNGKAQKSAPKRYNGNNKKSRTSRREYSPPRPYPPRKPYIPPTEQERANIRLLMYTKAVDVWGMKLANKMFKLN